MMLMSRNLRYYCYYVAIIWHSKESVQLCLEPQWPSVIRYSTNIQATTGKCRHFISGPEPLHISSGCSNNPKQIRNALRNILEWNSKKKRQDTKNREKPQRQIRQWKLPTEENFQLVHTPWKNDDTQSLQTPRDMTALSKRLGKTERNCTDVMPCKRQMIKKGKMSPEHLEARVHVVASPLNTINTTHYYRRGLEI